MHRELSHEYICSVLAYDPDTGIIRWKVDRGKVRAGAIAGTLTRAGYRTITINKLHFFYLHRLAFLFMTGEHVPSNVQVHHRNRVRDDNRWENLELETPAEHLTRGRSGYGDPDGSVARQIRSALLSLHAAQRSLEVAARLQPQRETGGWSLKLALKRAAGVLKLERDFIQGVTRGPS